MESYEQSYYFWSEKMASFCVVSRHKFFFPSFLLWFRLVGLNTYVIEHIVDGDKAEQYMRKMKSYSNKWVTHLHIQATKFGIGTENIWWIIYYLTFGVVFSLSLCICWIRSRSVCSVHAINRPLDIQSVA